MATQSVKAKSYVKGAAFLAIASLIAKLVGAIYRIPLTNILGAEGIGLYQLAFPIYALLLTLSGSSIPTAVARLISERTALDDLDGEKRVANAALITMLTGGLVMAIALFALAVPLATAQGNAALAPAYMILAPCILLVALSGLLRGWFQGKLNMRPTAYMQIAEQLTKMAAGIILASVLIQYSLMHAVIGAFLAVTIAEATALATLVIMYYRQRGDIRYFSMRTDKNTLKIVTKCAFPIVLSGLVMPLVQFIDSLLIVRVLGWRGIVSGAAISQYGLLSGVSNSLANMPVVLTLALAVAIVPSMAMLKSQRDLDGVRTKTATSIKSAYFIGMPCFVAMAINSRHIINALYPNLAVTDRNLTANLLIVASLQIIIFSVLQIYGSIMQGLGFQNRAVKHMLVGGAIKIILDFVFIYYIGIMGAAVAAVLGFGVVAVLNSIFANKIMGKNGILLKSISKILLSSVIMSIVAVACNYIANSYIALGVVIVGGLAVYALTALFTKAFSEEELRSLPLGDKLAKFVYRNSK